MVLSCLGVSFGGFLIASSVVMKPQTVEANHVEEWFPGHSWIPHVAGWQSGVQAWGTLASSGWIGHFNNAVGSWNDEIGDDPFWWDPAGDASVQVTVLESGSFDESNLDSLKWQWDGHEALYSCSSGDDGTWWGTVAPYQPGGADDYPGHYAHYKVCIWPGRVPNQVNFENWHYRWLTIKHELGHVLALGDDEDGDGCLMLQGWSMQGICWWELDFVRGHYNRW
jgi:hypothetical protein